MELRYLTMHQMQKKVEYSVLSKQALLLVCLVIGTVVQCRPLGGKKTKYPHKKKEMVNHFPLPTPLPHIAESSKRRAASDGRYRCIGKVLSKSISKAPHAIWIHNTYYSDRSRLIFISSTLT